MNVNSEMLHIILINLFKSNKWHHNPLGCKAFTKLQL